MSNTTNDGSPSHSGIETTQIRVSVVEPIGRMLSSCGYCHRSSSSMVYLTSESLTCADYQAMIDRGWRRAGNECYKPDLQRACCPQYTIRLDALQFKPSKSQRKVISRWNRFVLYGNEEDNMGSHKEGPSKKPPKLTEPFSLTTSIHASEEAWAPADSRTAHKFEVTLEPSNYTEEKYNLSCKYQSHVHDSPFTRGSFTDFLVVSCLMRSPIPLSTTAPDHLPRSYGTHHQLYRLDGKLIALAILDILPGCVSSVYFMYDPQWEKYSFGKLSAMREATLARELYEHGLADLKYLYMGFYIHTCPKMRYKGEYSPSFLLDPEEYNWFPYDICTKMLEKYRYASFSHPERSLKEGDSYPPRPSVPLPDPEDMNTLSVFNRNGTEVHLDKKFLENSSLSTSLLEVIDGLGWGLARQMAFVICSPSFISDFDIGDSDSDHDYFDYEDASDLGDIVIQDT